MTQFTYPPLGIDKTGLATSANQSAEMASLASIDSKTPALGQAVAASSQPVVLTAAQLSTLTPLTSVAVSNFPASQAVTGPLTDTQLRATPVPISGTVVTGGLTDAQLRASAVPTSLVSTTVTNTVAVSAAALPLPAGASTSALQSTANTSLNSIDTKTPALGQALAASSVPVVLTAAQLSTLTPLSSVSVSNFPSSQAVTGTFFQATQPVSIAASVAVTGPLTDTQLRATPVPVSGTISTGGLTDTQLRASAVPVSLASTTVTNTVATTLASTTVTNTVAVSAAALPLPTGAATSALQSTIDASVNSLLKPASTLAAVTTVSTVTTVGAVTAITNALPTGNNVIGFVKAAGKSSSNAPVRLDYTSTSVTTAAFTQLVASTTSATSEIEIFDSSGQTMALAFGAAASEVVQINIFPGGQGRVVLSIPAGTRVSIKALSATASVGEIDINFLG